MQHIKCVIVGDGYVGKTAMVATYAGKEWPRAGTSFDDYTLDVTVDGKLYCIAVWDVGGTTDYDRLRPLFYPDTDILLVCFAVNDPLIGTASFENILPRWIPEITHHCPKVPFILVGTKIDQRNDQDAIKEWSKWKEEPITTEMGKELAKTVGAVKYMECSAITQEGLANVFEEVVRTFEFTQRRGPFSRLLGHFSKKSTQKSNVQETNVQQQQKLHIIKHQQLELLDVIGQGGFGAVFRGKWKARKGEVVAVKKCTLTGTKRDPDIPREVQILSSVPEHPNIISFYGISINYPDIFIVTEFAEKGALFDYLHKEKQVPTIDQSLAWALQVAQGMEHLHNHDIIHRDLKSANVLLSAATAAKVCDFGTARYLSHTTVQTKASGTFRWMAPEVMEAVEANINKKCDSFSYGMVVYELLVHQVPYYDTPGDGVVCMKVLQGERPVIPPTIPQYLHSLLTACWDKDPHKRPTFHDTVVGLQNKSF